MSDFYGAVAGACFALLGLWWVVVELNHERWIRDPALRRMAYRTSLYFLLPGTISIISMLDVETPLLWRSVFLVGAAVGLIDVVIASRRRGSGTAATPSPLLLAAFVVFLCIAVIAAHPPTIKFIGAPPVVAEGFLLALLVLLGCQMAWGQFVASARSAEDEAPRP